LKTYKYYIGIDAGVNTGICVWSKFDSSIRHLSTVKIHEAMKAVEYWHTYHKGLVKVRVEDARKRKWFGEKGVAQLQGAGSIKRDCKIWEDFLTDLGIDFEMVAPKNNRTKVSGDVFRRMTGFVGAASEHARDAAMLVYKL